MLTTELNILKKIQHENLVRLHDLYETKDGVYIVTDLARGGELFQQLLLKGSYTEKDAASLVRQILKGVEYLHENGIVHRDLKPENLLFKDKLEDSILMITDFGLSKILTKSDDVLMTACGTPGYVAPEVLLQKGYNKPVDLWSVGVITYTMLCGYPPFYGENQAQLLQSIMAGKYDYEEEDWCDISDDAKDLVDKLLCYDPLKRITVKEALQHNWFMSAADVNLLDTVRKNLSPKDAFKRAVRLVQGVNRLQRLSKIKHQDGNDTIMQEQVVTIMQEQVVTESG
ncbi:6589_t:CDS:2 [Racocetra fulgida]|uniref:6589_t:CDS:1 n=1 Tax=Racocetra fulgida TaxID=60492 RepID=A0A9N8ZE92_9GLOM|nr:6589_t:CDS:2 [Racocetra fulgida]